MFNLIIQIIKAIINYPSKVGKAIDEAMILAADDLRRVEKYHNYDSEMFKQLRELKEQREFEQHQANKVSVLSDQLMSRQQKKDHLQSEYWSKLKVAKLQQCGNYCEKCGKLSKHLDLHHKTYIRLGFEDISNVILLCRTCHEHQHQHYGKDRKTDYSKIV